MIRNTFAALLTLVFLAGSARGEQIQAKFLGAYGDWVSMTSAAKGNQNVYLGPYEFKLTELAAFPSSDYYTVKQLLDFQANQSKTTVLTFCFDLYQTISKNNTYTYNIATGDDLIGLPAPTTRSYDIDAKKLNMLAYLWDKAYDAGAYSYAATDAGHAFSLAIWETLYEYQTLEGLGAPSNPSFNVANGTGFKVTNWQSLAGPRSVAITTLANGWLTQAYNSPMAQDIDWLVALYNDGDQDQTTIFGLPEFKPVPEPTLAIQLLGLCVAGALPLRYWRRGRKGAA